MTVKEAFDNGYKPYDTRRFRGYISNKTNIEDQEVCEAKGTRKGELYYNLPDGTMYYYRIYIKR